MNTYAIFFIVSAIFLAPHTTKRQAQLVAFGLAVASLVAAVEKAFR